MTRPEFTERQAAAWPDAIAEVQRYVDTSVSFGLHNWTVEWDEESRPGRGHAFDGVWCDGEHLVQIRMDVYGHPSVSVAAVDWLHNSSDEECPCEPCAAARKADS